MLKTERVPSLATVSIGHPNFRKAPDFERIYGRTPDVERCCEVLGAPDKIRASFAVLNKIITGFPRAIQTSLSEQLDKLNKALALSGACFEEAVSFSANNLRIAVKLIDPAEFNQRDVFIEKLNSLITEVDHARYLKNLPLSLADGMFKTWTYYSPPGALVEMRKSTKQRPDLFDVIVIGGGPSGIAALEQLAGKGVDALMLTDKPVQSMSDARAYSVSTMRTNAEWSSIAGNGELNCLNSDSTMAAVMSRHPLRAEVENARRHLEERFGYHIDAEFPVHDDYRAPVTRPEVFAYFHQLLADAQAHENINVLEQARVSGCSLNPDGTIRVETASGEVFHAKKIIHAPGFVGPEAEYGRTLEDSRQLAALHPEKVLILSDENSVYENSRKLENIIRGNASSKQTCVPFINEAILGHPEVNAIIKLLPEGSRVAIVGSGETAVKAVLKLLSINPGIKVDLFLKAPLEPSDPQSPAYLHSGPKLLRGLVDDEFADDSLRLRVPFGTPVTYETARRVIEETQSGEVRVFELGAHFSEEYLNITPSEVGCSLSVSIDPQSDVVRKGLQRQHDEWTACGLDASWLEPVLSGQGQISELTGPVLVCAGYMKLGDRIKESHGLKPISSLIVDPRGNVQLGSDNFTAASNSNVAFCGAFGLKTYGDTGFYGGGLRARMAAELLSREFGSDYERELAALTAQIPSWREADNAKYAALPERFDPEAEGVFDSTPGLKALHKKAAAGAVLNSVEQLLYQRGARLQERMYPLLRAALPN